MTPDRVPGDGEAETVLHRCDGESEGCFCMYDPECTGRFARHAIKLPIWLGIILHPLHSQRVLNARRILRERDRA